MPRTARKKSESSIYHIMLRGSNKKQIFYDDEDYYKFLEILRRAKEKSGFKLYAYCLMGNHVHLLIKETDEPLEIIFRRIGAAFVYWYNVKYELVGHLFQDRYKSEPVNDDSYFLTALRYILNNPVNAGQCSQPEEYIYSSAREYVANVKGITDVEFAQHIIGEDELIKFLAESDDGKCMDIEEQSKKRLTDTEAIKRIESEFGVRNIVIKNAADRETISPVLKKLLAEGISIRQLSRLTGLSKKIIENCKKC